MAAKGVGLLQLELIVDPSSPAGIFALEADPADGNGLTGAGAGRNLGPETGYIITTSGTTSERKLIPETHDRVLDFARTMGIWLAFQPEDLSLHLAPMYFANGTKSSLVAPLLNGVSIVCPPAYRAELFFRLLEEFKPTYFSASFTIFRDILRHVETHEKIATGGNLRFVRSGSGRLFPEEIRRLEDVFDAPLIVGLGTTEAGWVAGNPLPPGIRKRESVGRPLSNHVGRGRRCRGCSEARQPKRRKKNQAAS